MIALTHAGGAHTYTHTLQVALARILQGFGEAGCTPFATAIIADYFPKAVLGTAISFYNIGIYTGERGGNRAVCVVWTQQRLLMHTSLCCRLRSFTGHWQHLPAHFRQGALAIRVLRQSHAAPHLLYGHSSHLSLCSYVIFGAVGVVVAVVVGLTVRVKQESRARSLRVSVPDESQRSASTARLSVSELVRYWLFSPTLILLYVVLSVWHVRVCTLSHVSLSRVHH